MSRSSTDYVLARAGALLRDRQLRALAKRIAARLYDRSESIGLFRDLAEPVEVLASQIPVTIRSIQEEDVSAILNAREPGLSPEDRHDINVRLMVLTAGIRTCYVGVDPSGTPCYIQWMVGNEENEKLLAAYHGWYPRLAPDEVLMEYLYVPPAFRGKRIMRFGITHQLASARARGTRRVVTFIPKRNRLAIRLHIQLGFQPYVIRTTRMLLFSRSTTFNPIDNRHPL